MQPSTPAGEPVVRIGDDDLIVADPGRNHSQQDGPARADPATDAGANRPRRAGHGRRLPGRFTGHHGV